MFWIKPARKLAKALLAAETSRQLALGFAMGMVVGLVPKANLTAVVLTALVFSCRVNKAMTLVGIALFTCVGPLVEPLAHRVGWAMLSHPPLAGMWTWLMDLPLVPWMRLNNTVVLGSLVLGLIAVYPVYRMTRPLVDKLQPRVAKYLLRFRVTQMLLGADLATH